jgi:hypothetical protein
MNKPWLWIQGMWSCISWVFVEIYKEYCPDLNFKNIPLHPNDYLWYAERWNGRFAMVAVVFILQWELITGQSIWEFIGVR